MVLQLAEIHRHTWVVAGSAGCRGGELELELPMMSVVQTHILPTEDDCDPDVLQAITSLGCFKDRKKLIQELLNPKSVSFTFKTSHKNKARRQHLTKFPKTFNKLVKDEATVKRGIQFTLYGNWRINWDFWTLQEIESILLNWVTIT